MNSIYQISRTIVVPSWKSTMSDIWYLSYLQYDSYSHLILLEVRWGTSIVEYPESLKSLMLNISFLCWDVGSMWSNGRQQWPGRHCPNPDTRVMHVKRMYHTSPSYQIHHSCCFYSRIALSPKARFSWCCHIVDHASDWPTLSAHTITVHHRNRTQDQHHHRRRLAGLLRMPSAALRQAPW